MTQQNEKSKKSPIHMIVWLVVFVICIVITHFITDKTPTTLTLTLVSAVDTFTFFMAIIHWAKYYFYHPITTVCCILAALSMMNLNVSKASEYPFEGYTYGADKVTVYVLSDGTKIASDGGSVEDLIVLPSSTSGDMYPQISLCMIVGGAIIIGGSYVAYRIYKCAKKNLNPPPPPTNAPPANNNGGWPDVNPNAPKVTSLPPGNDISDFSMDDNVITNGWKDWQGNLISWAFSGNVTDWKLGTNTWAFHSSSNLINWDVQSVIVTGWVSQAASGLDSNSIIILYTPQGKPFSTNWCRYDQTGTNTTIIGKLDGPPIDKTKRCGFFTLKQISLQPVLQ